MGNRAIITAAPFDAGDIGIYVHWNGGRASIEGFCAACRELGFRSPDNDPNYGLARLTQAIATFFGNDGLSVGVGIVDRLDSENGVYVVGSDWQIVERRHCGGEWPTRHFHHEEVNPGKTAAIAAQIVQQLRATEERPA